MRVPETTINPSTLDLSDCIHLLFTLSDNRGKIAQAIATSGKQEELHEYWEQMDTVRAVAEALTEYHRHRALISRFEEA